MRAIAIDNDAGFRLYLQRVIEPVEEPAQCDARGELDDLPLAEMLAQPGEHLVLDPPGPGVYGERVVAHQALHRVEARDLGLEDPIHGLARQSLSFQHRGVVTDAIP